MSHAILEQASLAASAALGALLLLLLLGTQILDWYWPVLLFAASFAVGLYRVRRRIPSLYRLAQWIDCRLGLHDTLSTAYHFRDSAPGSAAEFQRRRAEVAAAEAELARAIPTPMPRSCYTVAGLLALSATLFAMRYMVTNSMDLKAPIAQISFGAFEKPQPEQAQKRKSAIQERFEEQMRQMGMSLDPVDDHPGANLPPEAPNTFTATPDGRAPLETNEKANGKGDQKMDSGSAPETDEKGERSDGNADGESGAPDALQGLNVNGKQNQQQNPKTNAPSKNGQQSSSSMLDKMRDAMANLMNKLKMPGANNDSPQQSASNDAAQQSGGQQSQGQRQAGAQNKSNGQGQQQGQQTGEQQGEGTEQAQAGGSKSGEQSSDQPGGQDSKSGMGKQDGDKSIQNAEQLAAMGKISEIIGKRQAQIQGEMTVEVPSGKQSLKTAYTRRSATHTDAGSQLNREEIPLLLQPYVQKYFDEIRKTAPAPKPEPAKTRS